MHLNLDDINCIHINSINIQAQNRPPRYNFQYTTKTKQDKETNSTVCQRFRECNPDIADLIVIGNDTSYFFVLSTLSKIKDCGTIINFFPSKIGGYKELCTNQVSWITISQTFF